MDIDIDQSVPRNDMIMLPDGKYLYINPDDGKPYVDVYRRDFQQWRDRRNERSREQLEKLNVSKPQKPYDVTLSEFTINTKDAVFSSLDDLLKGELNIHTLIYRNRLIYLGIFIMCFSIIMYILTTCK